MEDQTKISRRKFLKVAGIAAGATALACCGATALGTRAPTIDYVESSFGDGNEMNDKILVAYASRAGSTGEMAEAIGQILGANGAIVDVRLVDNVDSVGGYRAVVVGSAIRIGKWLPEATKFVETHQASLRQVPTAYFLACGTLMGDTEANRREAASLVNPVRAIVEPVDVGLFGGRMDYGKLSLLEHLIIQYMIKMPEGDYRDWDAIHAWAEGLKPALTT